MLLNTKNDGYFNWLCDLVHASSNYHHLMCHLFNKRFRAVLDRDMNREADGRRLRQQFFDQDDVTNEPASILEVMIALAIRCEEDIMADDVLGDRTSMWFWQMVSSLGLRNMTDSRYNYYIVESILENFLDKNYAPNGKGGLFTVVDDDVDMRELEIWYQMHHYIGQFD